MYTISSVTYIIKYQFPKSVEVQHACIIYLVPLRATLKLFVAPLAHALKISYFDTVLKCRTTTLGDDDVALVQPSLGSVLELVCLFVCSWMCGCLVVLFRSLSSYYCTVFQSPGCVLTNLEIETLQVVVSVGHCATLTSSAAHAWCLHILLS